MRPAGRSERPAHVEHLRDGSRDLDKRTRIDPAHGRGERGRVTALVMSGRADDDVEVRSEGGCNILGFLVAGHAGDEDPLLFAVNLVKRGHRLPDAVRRMADIDDRQGILRDRLQAAGPACFA